jgi:hypothetical protein
MAQAYLTEKQIPQNFWYFAIQQAARMMNVVSRKYTGKLASPFMLIHGVCPDQQAWLPIFPLSYFYHKTDSNALCSKNQAHTLKQNHHWTRSYIYGDPCLQPKKTKLLQTGQLPH